MDFHDPDAPERLTRMLGGPPTACCPTWRPTRPATARPTICASSAWSNWRPTSPARCWRRAASSSPRCCRAAPRATCWRDLKRDFAVVRHVKPKASRADSAELYVLATGFRGAAEGLGAERLPVEAPG